MKRSVISAILWTDSDGIEGLSPDSEPDPARMAEIIDFVKANHVKVIFFEDW